jgi:hypothetical protein
LSVVIFPKSVPNFNSAIQSAVFGTVEEYKKIPDTLKMKSKKMYLEDNDRFNAVYDNLIKATDAFDDDKKYGNLLKRFATNLIDDSFILSECSNYMSPYYRSSTTLNFFIGNLSVYERQRFLKKMRRCFNVWINHIQSDYTATE